MGPSFKVTFALLKNLQVS